MTRRLRLGKMSDSRAFFYLGDTMIRLKILVFLLALMSALPAQSMDSGSGTNTAEEARPCKRDILNVLRNLTESQAVPPELKSYVTDGKIIREESNTLCNNYVWTNLTRGRYEGKIWDDLTLKQQSVMLYAIDMAHDEMTAQADKVSATAKAIIATGLELGSADGNEGFKFTLGLSTTTQITGINKLLGYNAKHSKDPHLAVGGTLVQSYHREIIRLDSAVSKLFANLNPDKKRNDLPPSQKNATLQDISAMMGRLAVGGPGACRGALAPIDQPRCGSLANDQIKVNALISALNKYAGKASAPGMSLGQTFVKEAKAKAAAEKLIKEHRIDAEKRAAEADKKIKLLGQATDAWVKKGPLSSEQPAAIAAGGPGVNQKELGARPANLGLGLDALGRVPSVAKPGHRPKHSPQLSLDPATVATAKAIRMDFGPGRSLALPALTAALTSNPTKAEAQEMIKTAAKPGFWGRLFGKKKTPAEIEATIDKNNEKQARREAAGNSQERLKLLTANKDAVSSAAKAYNKAEQTAIAAHAKTIKEADNILEKSKNADKNNPGWGILEQAKLAHKKSLEDAESVKTASVNAADKAFQDATSPSRKAYDDKFGATALREKEDLAKAQAARAVELYEQRKTVYVEKLAANVKAVREDPKWLKNNIPTDIQKIDALNGGTAGQDRMDRYFAQEWSDDASSVKNMTKCEERGIRDAKKCIAAGFIDFNKPKPFEPLAGAAAALAALERPTPLPLTQDGKQAAATGVPATPPAVIQASASPAPAIHNVNALPRGRNNDTDHAGWEIGVGGLSVDVGRLFAKKSPPAPKETAAEGAFGELDENDASKYQLHGDAKTGEMQLSLVDSSGRAKETVSINTSGKNYVSSNGRKLTGPEKDYVTAELFKRHNPSR